MTHDMTSVCVQKETASKLLASEPKVIQLLQWCHKRSAEFAKAPISPAEFPIGTTEITYRGVTALKRITRGTRILFMPESVLITSSNFPQELCISPEEEAEGSKLNLHEKFVVFLLSEIKKNRKSKSEFAPYLETLPQDFSSHHPGYLGKDAIQCLPSWMTSLILNQQNLISAGFDKSVKVLDKSKRLTLEDVNGSSLLKTVSFEEYRWAWYVVNTRTVFYMKKENDGTSASSKEMALAPFLDLFNHAPQPNTEVTFEQGKGYSIVATEDIDPKEQIFISYGSHPNYKLWSEYGFIPFQSNPFNYIPFDYEAYQQQDDDRLLQKVNSVQSQKSMWLRNVLNDKRKRSHIQDLGLTKELSLFENELSANLEMLITLSLWDPERDSQNFVFTLKKSSDFLTITKDIIEYERLCFHKAASLLRKCDSSVAKIALQFCETCQVICDNLLNSCKLLS